MTAIVLVNAGSPLSDAEISALVPAFRIWDDMMLRPAWSLDACTYSFMPWAFFASAPPDLTTVQPIFFNNHSTDATILGFHDFQNGETFGRIFAGDCVRDGISYTVDASHEAAEQRVNPKLTRNQTLANGDICLIEAADPVESDTLAIPVTIDGVLFKMSDFVLPAYFDGGPGPYDYLNKLTGMCPTLTDGGYQSLFRKGATEWSQVMAARAGEGPSVRALRFAQSRRLPRFVPQQGEGDGFDSHRL